MMDAASSRIWRWALVWPLCHVSLASAFGCVTSFTYTDIAAVSTGFSICPTVNGDVTISGVTLTASSPAQPTLTVNDLQEVNGNLEFVDITVEHEDPSTNPAPGSFALSVANVTSVSGGLTFRDMRGLEMPYMTNLTSVKGTMTFANLTFGEDSTEIGPQFPHLSTVGSLYFSDTTARSILFQSLLQPGDQSFDGESQASILIMENSQLSQVEINGYQNAEVDIAIRANDPELRVSLPNISKASILLQGVAHFDADGLMYIVAGPLNKSGLGQDISENTFEFFSLPNLDEIQNTTLQIDRNINLGTLGLKSLGSAYDLEITDNTNLHSVGLPSLTSVGVLEISGPISSVSLPRLTDSALVHQVSITPAEQSACPSLNMPSDQYHCTATGTATHSPTSSVTQSPGSGSGSTGGGGLSKDAKIGIGVGVGVGVLAIAALVFFWCCTRRSKRRSPRSAAAGQYYMSETKGTDQSSTRYTKVPVSGTTEERSSGEQISPPSRLGDNWYPPEQHVPTTDGRIELEEQQRPRHEMDARSLQDIDLDDDREETRSLEDIERAHGHIS